jgi:hypothetical protein
MVDFEINITKKAAVLAAFKIFKIILQFPQPNIPKTIRFAFIAMRLQFNWARAVGFAYITWLTNILCWAFQFKIIL